MKKIIIFLMMLNCGKDSDSPADTYGGYMYEEYPEDEYTYDSYNNGGYTSGGYTSGGYNNGQYTNGGGGNKSSYTYNQKKQSIIPDKTKIFFDESDIRISIFHATYNTNTYFYNFAFQKLYTTFLISIKLLTEIFELIKDEPLFTVDGTHPKAQEYINKIHPDDLKLLNNFILQSFKDSYKSLIDLVKTKERSRADFILKQAMFMGNFSLDPIFTFLNKYKKNFKSLFINFDDQVHWSLSSDSYGFNSVKSFDIFMDLFESIFAASEQPKGSNANTNNANNNTNSNNTKNNTNTNNANNKNNDDNDEKDCFFCQDIGNINKQLDNPTVQLFTKMKDELQFIIEGLTNINNKNSSKYLKFIQYLKKSKNLKGAFHALHTRMSSPVNDTDATLNNLFFDVFKIFPFPRARDLGISVPGDLLAGTVNWQNNVTAEEKKEFCSLATTIFQSVMKKAEEVRKKQNNY